MIADVVNTLKEIQIDLFMKELRSLEKGKIYINESFNLSLLIDSSKCANSRLLKTYINYFKSKCNGKL